MSTKFDAAGNEGHPPPDLWRKGVVYLDRRARMSQGTVAASFMRVAPPDAGFHALYTRARNSAARMAEWPLLGHCWRPVTPGVATAFVVLASDADPQAWPAPSDEDLRSPGGVSHDELSRLAALPCVRIFREFDFSGPESREPVTVSYAEKPAADSVASFEPFVERAEEFARQYHRTLSELGEVDGPFRAMHREWFLADAGLVTVHVCFER